MQVLVFDSSLDKTYITLGLQSPNGETTNFISKKIVSTEQKYHSAFLVSQIKEMLNANAINLKHIDGIGVNIGPGSFTGLRVTLSVAKTLAQQLSLRIVGIPSYEILSKSVLSQHKNAIVIMDARRSMSYYYNPLTDTKVSLLPKEGMLKTLETLSDIDAIVCDNSTADFLADKNLNLINYEKEALPIGETLAGMTLVRLKNTNKISECHWSMIKPLYIQTPPIFK